MFDMPYNEHPRPPAFVGTFFHFLAETAFG